MHLSQHEVVVIYVRLRWRNATMEIFVHHDSKRLCRVLGF